MTDDTKCFYGLHKYEVYKEIPVIDYIKVNDEEKEVQVGINIVTKCTNCGKLHVKFVATDINHINQRA